MNKRMKIAAREGRILVLGKHLRGNLQMLRGEQAVVIPEVRLQQFAPLLVILFCMGMMAGSARARESVLINLVLLASRAFLQHGDAGEAGEVGDADDFEE